MKAFPSRLESRLLAATFALNGTVSALAASATFEWAKLLTHSTEAHYTIDAIADSAGNRVLAYHLGDQSFGASNMPVASSEGTWVLRGRLPLATSL
jgi:hypothetical protein